MTFEPMSARMQADLDQRVARWVDHLRICGGIDLTDQETRRVARALLLDLIECLNVRGANDPAGTAGAAVTWTVYLAVATGGTIHGIERA